MCCRRRGVDYMMLSAWKHGLLLRNFCSIPRPGIVSGQSHIANVDQRGVYMCRAGKADLACRYGWVQHPQCSFPEGASSTKCPGLLLRRLRQAAASGGVLS